MRERAHRWARINWAVIGHTVISTAMKYNELRAILAKSHWEEKMCIYVQQLRHWRNFLDRINAGNSGSWHSRQTNFFPWHFLTLPGCIMSSCVYSIFVWWLFCNKNLFNYSRKSHANMDSFGTNLISRGMKNWNTQLSSSDHSLGTNCLRASRHHQNAKPLLTP